MKSEDGTIGVPLTNDGAEATQAARPGDLRQVWRNTLTVGGVIVAGFALLFMLAFFVIEFASPQRSPYLGLFTFLVFPCILVFGLIAMGTGLLVARRRFRKTFGPSAAYQYYPRIDLTDARQRRILGFASGGVALAIPMVGILSYEGYHYTDSNQFCGAVCHTVMQPQYTAYQHSAHAHVGCAECHIGAGASWYVKSKLSGIRQVFAVALNSYPRPIPPAIQELRPATETCRECHWPAKFYGDQLVTVEHFASDEANTHSQHRMLLKTGGSDPSTGPPSGIHWHMALGFTIEYVAVDQFLQDIRWVKMTDHSTGRQAVYRSDGLTGADPLPVGTLRTVDCMDCHNRPTHVFRSPDRAVNSALNVNPTLLTLPFAKREVVAVLAKPYASKAEGLASIADVVARFYEREYPKIWESRKADVDRLILVTKDIYSTNFFPEMNVSWRTYPDNIGHKIFPGCFRCHEGKHVDESGRAISHECKTCHEFLRPVGETAESATVGIGGFVHPYELEGLHATMRCDKCHTGGVSPQPTCAGCHTTVAEFRSGTMAAFKTFGITAEPMAETIQCTDCHDLKKPTSIEAMNKRCIDCHADDEQKYGAMLASWTTEVNKELQSSRANAAPQAKRVLELLQAAGPLHNIAATRKILHAIGAPGTPVADEVSSEDSPASPAEK